MEQCGKELTGSRNSLGDGCILRVVLSILKGEGGSTMSPNAMSIPLSFGSGLALKCLIVLYSLGHSEYDMILKKSEHWFVLQFLTGRMKYRQANMYLNVKV